MAATPYDAFAPIYDAFNRANDYEQYLGRVLLPALERYGLRSPDPGQGAEPGARALDLGCGTGQAFQPLLDRGWDVWGMDSSMGMLEHAWRKFGGRVPLLQVDMRALRRYCEFDLVLALNDVLNYLTDADELERALVGISANLAPRGLLVCDLASLATFRFACGAEGEGRDVGPWRLQGVTREVAPGAVGEYRISGEGVQTHVHRTRHWPRSRVTEAIESAGLRCVGAHGLREDGGAILLTEEPDEAVDTRTVYFVRRAGGGPPEASGA